MRGFTFVMQIHYIIFLKRYTIGRFNPMGPGKDAWLQENRRVSFKAVKEIVENGKELDVISNPSSNHPGQEVFVVLLRNTIHLVPFTEDERGIFLITIIPRPDFNQYYFQ